MSTTRSKKPQKQVRRPEKKIGPFHAGLGVAIWMNSVETEHGPRWFRSITIAQRRYRDSTTGNWKSATSFRPGDLTTLQLALAEAHRYVTSTPLPGQAVDGDEYQDMHVLEDGELVDEPPAA